MMWYGAAFMALLRLSQTQAVTNASDVTRSLNTERFFGMVTFWCRLSFPSVSPSFIISVLTDIFSFFGGPANPNETASSALRLL